MKQDSLDALILAYQEAGKKWVSAKLACDQLEESKASFLAALENEKKTGKEDTQAELHRAALADDRYRDFLSNMCHARAVMLALKVRFDALEMFFEAMRTKEATNRQMISKGLFDRGR